MSFISTVLSIGIGIEVYAILIILAIPIYLFWLRLLRNVIIQEKRKKFIVLIITVITIPIIYVVIIFSLLTGIYYYPDRDFDKEQWFNNKEKRYELSHDIIESRMLIGKTKNEVQQILGNEYSSDGEDHWMYELGFRPQLSAIDPDVLDVIFINGKVVRVGQHET